MDIWSLLSLLSFSESLVFLFLGIYAYRIEPKAKLNKLFLYLCISFLIWNLSCSFIYIATTPRVYWFWNRVGSIGLYSCFSIILNLLVVFTHDTDVFKKKWMYVILYLPSVLLILGVNLFVIKGQNAPNVGRDLFYPAFFVYYFCCVFAALPVTLKWASRAKTKREKRQFYILIFSGCGTSIVGAIIHYKIHDIGIYTSRLMGHLSFLILAYALWYVIVKLKIMGIHSFVTADEIMYKVKELVIILDKDRKIIKVNHQVEEILGYHDKELYKKGFDNIIALDECSQRRLKGMRNTINPYTEVELNYKAKNDQLIPVTVYQSFVYDKFDDIVGFTAIAHDMRDTVQLQQEISERKKSEEELKTLMEENQNLLEETIQYDKLKTEFFSNVSHELKTPLNIIFSTIQLVTFNFENNQQSVNTHKLNKYIGMIRQNCYRLLRLINNLIDITKIDSGFLQVNFQNQNIISVIENITLSVAQYIEHKGIKLEFDTEIEERITAFDPDQIERIMLNLLSNAIKFTKSGGEISVYIKDKKDSIMIIVKDTGIGIPKNKQKIIFQRFGQAHNLLTRTCEGSGIGLALVKSLIQMHEGDISMSSEEGKGTTFFIEIPVRLIKEEIQQKVVDEQFHSDLKIERINIEFSDIYSA